MDRTVLKSQIDEIKERVRGVNVSYKTGSQDEATIKGYFRASSQLSHHPFDSVEPIDPTKAAEARKKLSDSNFNMGSSPVRYRAMSTLDNPDVGVIVNTATLDRKRMAYRNSITNFVD